MKIVKPAKLPILHRVLERSSRTELHVAAMLGFPLDAPRSLLDELAFWATTASALGANGILDEGFAKPRGELLVAGSFFAPGGAPLPASYVRAQLGTIDKRLSVIGPRIWHDGVPTAPEPITTLPIDWAHAYGGKRFSRNPYGKGAEAMTDGTRLVFPLPNIEAYGNLVRSPTATPEPAGFLPMDVTFSQRRGRAGTYDQAWLEQHFPGLPPDAEPTFFNTAPEDQWTSGFFRGDEAFVVENMHPERPRLAGRLPGLVARAFATQRTSDGERFVEIPLLWDTVWLFPSMAAGVLIAHGSLPIAQDDAADIVHLVCACEDPASPRSAGHYQEALRRRLDKDKGALAGLSDSDLMPPRASGVAPNLGELDIGRWVKSENLAAQNLRRGAERKREVLCAEVEAEGLDPKDYGLTEPQPEAEAPPVDDLDALAAYMERESARADALLAEAKQKEEQAREELRKAAAEEGVDFDAVMAEGAKQAAGPPKFTAEEQLATLRELGVSDEECEARRAEFVEQEASLREMYRFAAHLQPMPAAPLDADTSERMRVLVQLALETGESLAGRDLTGVSLAGMSLRGIDLTGAWLESAELSGCDLSGAKLEGAVLARANLRGARLEKAVLRKANLGCAVLEETIVDGADLTEAVLAKAKLAGTRFVGATLTGVDWMEAELAGVDLSEAELGACTFLKTNLRGALFVGARLPQATLLECVLDGADFSRAELEKATFVTCQGVRVSFRGARFSGGIVAHGSSLPEADFRDAVLRKANFRGTVLSGARFHQADLTGADLSECDARRASFDRAVLREAMLIRTRLEDASLEGADLREALVSKAKILGASLRGANLYRADLSRVVGDERTTFAAAEVGRVRSLPKARGAEGGAA